MPARITDLTLRALEPGHQVRDTVLQGFGVRRHKSGRLAYYAYRQGPRPLYKVVGGSELTVTQAREAAKHVLAEHTLGHTKERGKGFTINSAWPLYREHLKRIGRVAGTMRVYENNIARLSPEIRKKPLALLGDDPGLMTTEHERLSVKTPAAADSSAMTVQALYRWVAKRHDRTLPAGSPCADLNLAPKPAAKPQRTLMRDDMRAWWGRVQQLRDPVRVQGHLFALLSGLRVDSLCQTRWDDLHRKLPNTLHIPKPKFGPTRAFDLPLSQAMIACLKRVMAHCAATGRLGARPNDYIFMRPDGSGPIATLSNDFDATRYRSHDLRRGYASAAKAAGVAREDVSKLLNHRTGLGVTDLYIREVLLPAQEKTSAMILAVIGDAALYLESDRPDDDRPVAWEREEAPDAAAAIAAWERDGTPWWPR